MSDSERLEAAVHRLSAAFRGKASAHKEAGEIVAAGNANNAADSLEVLAELLSDGGGVPRCDTCGWWEQGGNGPREGACRRTHDSTALTHGSKALVADDSGAFATLYTARDFGCVQHELKGRP